MGYKSAAIHTNLSLDHQVKYAKALEKGLKRHGITGHIVDRNGAGDLHIIIGNWFAPKWMHVDGTLMLDRAYWGNPESVSVHWMKGGEKVFGQWNDYRPHPEGMPYKSGDRKIYLADYGDKWGSILADYDVRWHPSQSTPERTLQEDLESHDIAIGRRTTALVDAAVMGLRVDTNDVYSPIHPISGLTDPVARVYLLNDLAWHNWSLIEIESGDMFDALGGHN